MSNKKLCECGYWNQEQEECLYSEFGCALVNEKPRVNYDFIKKEAHLLVSRFDCECKLTPLQKIGIRTVLTEKGDLWDILQRAGVEVCDE